MEGRGQITQAAAPAPFTVVLENAGDAVLAGAVRAQGIDGWRIEPAGQVSFSVAARSSARLLFAVIFDTMRRPRVMLRTTPNNPLLFPHVPMPS